MAKAGANVHVLTTLDDICWTLNIRGDDIEFFPLVLSYAIIKMDSMELYVDESKLNDEIKADLAALNVNLHPYNDIYEDIRGLDASDVVMVDPPRKGLDSKSIENLLKILPKKLVYISCNPATLVRDLSKLEDKYKITMIKPVDMFPFSKHIECVSLLKLR